MPGKRTSAIKQDVVETQPDFRKSSERGNAFATKPIDLTRSIVPSRTDSSSSTIEIKSLFAIFSSRFVIQTSGAQLRQAIAHKWGSATQWYGLLVRSGNGGTPQD